MSGSSQALELVLWRPASSSSLSALSGTVQGCSALSLDPSPETFAVNLPDLQAVREMIVCPYRRSEVNTMSVGSVELSVSVVTSGFTENGVVI